MRRLSAGAGLACLALGAVLGYWAALGGSGSLPFSPIRQEGYRLVHPLLDCELSEGALGNVLPSKQRLRELVDRSLLAGRAAHISVYYRDLNNGPWFGIHPETKFAPASLLKVPLLIAHLKHAESDPGVLGRRVPAEPSPIHRTQLIPPAKRLEMGKPYSVEDYLRHMIRYSDNDATYLLLRHADPKALEATYRDLRIEAPHAKTPEDWITVHEYASFFRTLFNASYLNREMSEKALQYLTETDFKEGIVAGVPPGAVVAHKFGERMNADRPIKQIHDCGIVYYPGNPYLLCVMTQGRDVPALIRVIREVSALAYAEVDRQAAARRDGL